MHWDQFIQKTLYQIQLAYGLKNKLREDIVKQYRHDETT